MKATENFKKTIKHKLEEIAANDPLFAKSYAKEGKTLDECINYILNQVKKIGAMGYTDDEIYGMATHYYNEDDLESCAPIEMGVVVNHKPELTPEEIDKLKKVALDQVLAEEKDRLRNKKPKSPAVASAQQPTLF